MTKLLFLPRNGSPGKAAPWAICLGTSGQDFAGPYRGAEWERILDCAAKLPITMGALPFGFELPLHSPRPEADFGASLASGTRSAEFFRECERTDRTDATAGAIMRICEQMETENSPLREIVGRKLMLEYDIGSAREGQGSFPGMFLRPGERPVIGAGSQEDDVVMVCTHSLPA